MNSQMNIIFKSLADKTRRQILEMLKKNDLTAGEIAKRFEMTKPSISHHLNILFQANLVKKRRYGQYINYSLNTMMLQDVLLWVKDFFRDNNTNEVV